MDAILALDIGTSGAKATLIDREGRSLAKAHAAYPLHVDGERVQQDPEDWWAATLQVLREIASRPGGLALRAIALTGQMQSTILMDEAGVIAPAILYSDTRASDEMQAILREVGEDELYRITGNLNDASSVLAKLLWLKRHQAADYERAAHVLLSAHDYIAWKLCGERVTDYTNAATTGLLDLEANAWSEALLRRLGLRADFLPRLAAADQVTGRLLDGVSRLTGLPQDLPVFHGAGDAATATIGSAAGEVGHFYIYLGTSGWLASTGTNRRIDPRSGFWNLRHPDPARLILLGPMLTTAGNLEWLNEQFGALEQAAAGAGASSYDAITAQAGASPAGAGGVIYLPHIAGERCPFRDPAARGVFFGIHRETTRGDLYRAVLEGVAFSMRAIREKLLEVIQPRPAIRELTLVGGGARSPLWAQIFSDVMGCPVHVLRNPEDVGAKGTAIIAGKALGWFDSYIPTPAFFERSATYEPQADTVQRYDRQVVIFQEIYPAVKGLFQKLAD